MDDKSIIQWADFEKIDIRVGTILEASEFPEARKPAYKLTIDFGPEGIKKSSAQVTQNYQPEQLVGRQILAVVNFQEKQIGKFLSQCLVLGIYAQDESVVLIQPDMAVENGCRLG